MKWSGVVARSIVGVGWLMLAPGFVGFGAWADDPDEARRHAEKVSGFSFVVPEGWTVREIPGQRYRIVHGPPAADFAPNINVTDEFFRGSADDYAKASLPLLKQAFKDFRMEKQEAFETKAGLRGVRTITENEQQGRRLRQTFYVFCTGERGYVVTCSALAEGGDQFDPVFERALKTFRFEESGGEKKAGS